jgi:hypothetical protein
MLGVLAMRLPKAPISGFRSSMAMKRIFGRFFCAMLSAEAVSRKETDAKAMNMVLIMCLLGSDIQDIDYKSLDD